MTPEMDKLADEIADRVVSRLPRPDRLLRMPEVADRLGISYRTLMDRFDEDPDFLPVVDLGVDGRRPVRRVAESDLEAYIARLKQSGGSDA